jgi:hypothetical protein
MSRGLPIPRASKAGQIVILLLYFPPCWSTVPCSRGLQDLMMMFSSDRILASSSDCLLSFSSICSANCQTHPGDRGDRQTDTDNRKFDGNMQRLPPDLPLSSSPLSAMILNC